MRRLTGQPVADAIADEIERDEAADGPRHFSLPAACAPDRAELTSELWSDLMRSGSLWSNVRLIHDGRDVHPVEFMKGRIGDGLVVHSAIDARATVAYLKRGATFIYNHLHETSYPIQRVQEILEYRIGARVWIQAYLTTASTTAFGLHRDDHNFVALQLAGSKRWELDADLDDGRERTLSAGDGVFLRAGTPHAVSGLGVLSLHLTIAFDWLPIGPPQAGSRLSEEELEVHARVARLGGSLPVSLDGSLLHDGLGIRFSGRVKPQVGEADANLVLTCSTGRFVLDRRLARTLDVLLSGREVALGELVEESGLPRRHVESFVRFAVGKGVLHAGS